MKHPILTMAGTTQMRMRWTCHTSSIGLPISCADWSIPAGLLAGARPRSLGTIRKWIRDRERANHSAGGRYRARQTVRDGTGQIMGW